ncbi:hypothetical protein GQ43DRAFT_367510 [Delitschia confertaspora ATCC 74209]|uniref:Malate dehydrogenase n=1 Tax=Delitschia confertaspora ATCC 74209 TaxID=1513339 RepID=A0A9P4JTZ6_9PLEO|nr:hypothetical protein GQ43DRAFT_367510 [Delitschia confertaspora ATCC 74209]
MPENTLPPPGDLQLKYVVLGIGTQNYTCVTSDSSSVPVSIGAIANLYDIGTRLSNDPLASYKLPTLSGLALSLSLFPTQLSWYLSLSGYQKVLGKHYFSADKVPTFSLSNVKPLPFPQAMVTKNDTMNAPKTACPGLKGEGAVLWLKLNDNGFSVGGVNTVYRLETAGGNAPKTCDKMAASFTVPYAAQYWIYGDK